MALAIEIEEEVFEPIPYRGAPTTKTICVVDTETDPFKEGRVPKPFCVGFYDGENYIDFWGEDCVEQFFGEIAHRTDRGDELMIYAHNGGNFDFHFFQDYLNDDQSPLLIGGRITQAYYSGQEFRDSYKILPAPLSAYKKDDIDYAWFEADKREAHKATILEYMQSDCVYTHELISKFHATFGSKITIGQAAIDCLTSTVGYAKLTQHQDAIFRNWFFGGRTQAFETGVLRPREGKRFKVYDVNSMYPYAMGAFTHPVGSAMEINQTLDGPNMVFAKIECSVNDGAFPRTLEDGSLDFTGGPGVYFVTNHELEAALELGLVKVKKVISAVHMPLQVTFEEFVDRFYKLRLLAKADGDDAMTLIYKLLLNNAYGKFAQDSNRYKQWWLGNYTALPPGYEEDRYDGLENPGGWRVHSTPLGNNLWCRANRQGWRGYRNVRIAASITGAARSLLLRGLAKADRPIYCDTDSIICEGLDVDSDPKRLGAWKLEAEGDRLAIAGKKLYALFDRHTLTSEGLGEKHVDLDEYGDLQVGETYWRPLKKASKGARLAAEQIVRVAQGHKVQSPALVPTFRMGEAAVFTDRLIGRTGKEIVRFGERKHVRW